MTQRTARVWKVASLIRSGCDSLAEGGRNGAALIDGRILSVKATPENGSTSKMTLGLSVLPPNYATPPHSHEAEELAHILSGEGSILIDGIAYPVTSGDIVFTPSQSEHVTIAGANSPLVIWWVYAPPGSESRWLSQGALDEDSGL